MGMNFKFHQVWSAAEQTVLITGEFINMVDGTKVLKQV